MGGDLSEAVIIGDMYEFIELRRVVCYYVMCPEGATGNGGVEDVDCCVIDGTFYSVANTERYG